MRKPLLKEKRSPQHNIFKFGVLIVLLVGFAAYGSISKVSFSQFDIVSTNQTINTASIRSTYQEDHDDDECIPHNKEDPCSYIKENENCEPDGYFDYLDLYYCKLNDKKWASYIIMFLWLVLLFFALGSTADIFFCPSLVVLGELLRMSPEIAGLTLLALGNGAPDVSSVIAGVVGSNSFPIAIGELFGSGLFIITIIVALVVFIAKQVQMDSHSFLRDTFFYLIAVLAVFFITWDCKITIVESILFLVYYFGYVSFALVVHYCGCLKPSNGDNENEEKTESENTPLIPTESTINEVQEEDEFSGYFTLSSWWKDFKELSILMKIYTLISTIMIFPIYISIPGVKWNRYQAVLWPVTSVPIFFIVSDQIGAKVNGFPIFVIVMICMIVPSVIIFLTTKWEEPPKYKYLFLAICFVLSVIWIFIIAEELVALLQALGTILNVSSAIMGATVLAWGNSIGDLVSDIVVTKKGNPRMALGATYGGPLFNLLVGLGLALTIKNIKTFPTPFAVAPTHLIYATAAFLFFALYTSMVFGFVRKYKLSWWFGIFLMVVYVVFTVIILLIELKIFWPDSPNDVCIPW